MASPTGGPDGTAPFGVLPPDALPAGWSVRLLDPPRDDDAVLALIEAYNRAVRERAIDPPQEVLDQLRALPDAGARDVLVVTDGDRRLRAFLPWEVETAAADPPSAWFDVFADPALDLGVRARLEAGLIHAGLHRTRSWARDLGVDAAVAQSGTYRRDDGLATRLRQAGMRPVRSFVEMLIDLTPRHAEPGAAPDGVQVRTADPRRTRLVHRLIQESFADHWGHHREPFESWWARRGAAPAYDPRQWWVAERDGEPVAVCLGDASRSGLGGGYVRTLGVVRAARGRGIAQHLLRVAFSEHLRRGWTWTSLGVDAASLTGADRLYRAVGMREGDTVDAYRAHVHPPGPDGAAGARPPSR